jgi:hypothetical protein
MKRMFKLASVLLALQVFLAGTGFLFIQHSCIHCNDEHSEWFFAAESEISECGCSHNAETGHHDSEESCSTHKCCEKKGTLVLQGQYFTKSGFSKILLPSFFIPSCNASPDFKLATLSSSGNILCNSPPGKAGIKLQLLNCNFRN